MYNLIKNIYTLQILQHQIFGLSCVKSWYMHEQVFYSSQANLFKFGTILIKLMKICLSGIIWQALVFPNNTIIQISIFSTDLYIYVCKNPHLQNLISNTHASFVISLINISFVM